jgi:hypothetical protein
MPEINSSKDLRTAVRNGPYAWPGGYPIFYLCDDGECLSYNSVKNNYRQILSSVRSKHNDGWRVVAYDINWESEMYDADTGEQIESAYDIVKDE